MNKISYLKIVSKNIIQLLEEKNQLNDFYKELFFFMSLYNKNFELRKFILSDKFNFSKKLNTLYSILNPYFSILFLKIIIYLGNKNTLNLIHLFYKIVKSKLEESIISYTVTVPCSIDKDNEVYIKKILQNKNSKKAIKCKIVVDTNILGGVIISNNSSSTLLDLSILGKINRLKIHYGIK